MHTIRELSQYVCLSCYVSTDEYSNTNFKPNFLINGLQSNYSMLTVYNFSYPFQTDRIGFNQTKHAFVFVIGCIILFHR